ncbi:MAG: hypothetical protein QXY39_06885 [Thermofilaceae archaeon]
MKFSRLLLTRRPGEIMVRVVYVVGRPRSGKTTCVHAIVAEIQKTHDVWYAVTRRAARIPELLQPEKTVNIFLIDDAMRFQFSRESMKKDVREAALDVVELAHIAEARGMKEGLIIIFIIAHTVTGVDLILRAQAEYILLKSFSVEDREWLERVGVDIYELTEWSAAVRRRDPRALSTALLITAEGAWGWLRFRPAQPRIDVLDLETAVQASQAESAEKIVPKLVQRAPVLERGSASVPEKKPEIWDVMDDAHIRIVAEMKHDPRWSRAAEWYEEAVIHGRTRREICHTYGMSDWDVSKAISRVKGEVMRRLGLVYEEIVAKRFPGAVHMGGESEPDIVIPGQAVIAVKIYYDLKHVVSIPISQIRPEIEYASRNGLRLYLVFANLAWKKEFCIEVPLPPPPRITIHADATSTPPSALSALSALSARGPPG